MDKIQKDARRRSRSKLTVFNRTNVEEGPGAELHLKWRGDTRPKDQESDVPVGESVTKESKYVGNGGNSRTFEVVVYKEEILIGTFEHKVYNPLSPEDAGESNAYIQVDYQRDAVLLYREYTDTNGTWLTDPIGTISREDWEGQ